MCLAAWAVQQNARFPWVIASNRDEYFDRPAAPLAWWTPRPGAASVLGGRDLAAGGTWLALTAAGGFALLTNVREPGHLDPALPSRGDLVTDSLGVAASDLIALATLAREPRNGFNLLRADLRSAAGMWLANRPSDQRHFGSGVHGLSNAALDTPWPKVLRLKQRLAEAVTTATSPEQLIAAAFDALADPTPAPDQSLPATGIPLAWERQLSPAFIHMEGDKVRATYGTRCSTVVVVEGQTGGPQRVHVVERCFGRAGQVAGETALQIGLGG